MKIILDRKEACELLEIDPNMVFSTEFYAQCIPKDRGFARYKDLSLVPRRDNLQRIKYEDKS